MGFVKRAAMVLPFTFRVRANVLILVFVGMLVASFGVAGYVLVQSHRQPGARAVAADVPVEKLLASGEEFLRKQQTEQAIVTYRRILTSNPNSVQAQMGLARAEVLAGREDLAADEYERALRLDGKNTNALLQLARLYSSKPKTWKLAEARFKDYLALEPNDTDAQLPLARLLSWQGKSKEAAAAYSNPGLLKLLTIEDQRSYVIALIKSGQTDRAEALLKRLLAGNRQDFELRLQQASLHASRQDWNSALPLYKSLLRERPDEARLHLTYGVSLLSARDYRAALEPLAKARSKMPSNAEAGLSYARALRGVKDYQAADKEYARVLPSFTSDGAVVREYADLLLEKRDYRKAEEYYAKAHGLGVRDVRLLVSFAGALRANGKPRAALPHLEEAYAREPTDRLAFELAKVMHEVGRHQQALQILSKIDTASMPASR
jgi:cytochrome c-type biogenesis protein CcmH/NrfG